MKANDSNNNVFLSSNIEVHDKGVLKKNTFSESPNIIIYAIN